MNLSILSFGAAVAFTLTNLLTSADKVMNYAGSIPPKPDQSTIICHNSSWEELNLSDYQGYGIHKKLLPFIKKMRDTALQNGIDIRINSAYRTCQEQGDLRASACGIGEYNLYSKPINLCFPPTEPAGKSLHNEGLAVDIACTGYAIFEYSPCYEWIKKYSPKYQIRQHELEAWHWSTTGK
jgi:LAS superfamily LD-carboxypeptidase LdcB